MSSTPNDAIKPPEHHGVAHVATFKSLVIIFALLLVLTGVTYIASLPAFNFGSANLVIALAIATFKSSLVVLYFMHLRYDKPFNSVVFVGCLIFVALFIGLALLDKTAYNHEVDKGQAKAMPRQPGDFSGTQPHK